MVSFANVMHYSNSLVHFSLLGR